MRTMNEVLELVEKLHQVEWFTEEWAELYKALSEDKIFTCAECGEKVAFTDLESYDFEDGTFICEPCYNGIDEEE